MSTLEFRNRLKELNPLLNAFALNLTKNEDDASDLYQETAYRAITNQEKFKEGTNLKAWLFTIMKNIFINTYRRNMKRNSIMEQRQNLYYVNSDWDSTGNKAEDNIFMNELHGMIDNLDESLKVPFIMHYEGYKYQEISDQLKLPLGTIKSRIFFARQELKHKIDKNYDNFASIRLKK